MYKEVSLKALIEQPHQLGADFVLYLQVKKEKVIIPAQLNYLQGKTILNIIKKEFEYPHIFDTLKRVALGLGGQPQAVIINTCSQESFGTQVQIKKEGRDLEIPLEFSDALGFGLFCNIPILVEEKILQVAGIDLEEEIDSLDSEITQEE